MKIAYFTTAQDNDEYLKSKVEINPSNQVFHTNLISTISLTNQVDVFSCRSNSFETAEPFSKENGNISWNYLKNKKSKFANLYTQVSDIKKIKNESSIAFVDTINTRCLLIARAYAKKNKIPLIGIVTDNPYNITGAKNRTSSMLLKTAKKCDGFICLTNALNELFNKDNKPSLIIKGISKSNNEENSLVDYPYFFFAGTLLKKYGVIHLVKAFKSLENVDAKLVIAGHSNNDEFCSSIENNSNIVFLGNIPNEEVLKYENNAIANINPRPFMDEFDRYSIPSKVIEYSSKDSLIISGFSSELKDSFDDSILWIDEQNSLEKRLLEAYKLDSKVRKEMISRMKSIYEKEFSFESANKKIDDFISKIIH